MRDYDEKRSFQRMSIDCAVKVIDPADGCEYIVAGRDLSAEGISFLADSPVFTPGQSLEIFIEPAATIVPPLRAAIEVIRVSPEGMSLFVAAAIRRIL